MADAAPVVSEKQRDPGSFALAFGITWLSYASYYLGRKGFAVARKRIVAELGDGALVGVETAYLAAYAVGQYVNGTIGDRVGARRLIAVGMLASAAACAVFGWGGGFVVFFGAFLVNGLAQSSGWPGNVKAMAEWAPPARRGVIMGFWSTCYQLGGIAATAIAAWFLGRYGWRGAFHGPAVERAGVGVLVFLLLRPGPFLRRAASTDEGRRAAGADAKAAQRRLLRQPVIWSYGVSYFGIKLIRYSILFWLPFYLSTALGYPEERAAYLSTSFEIGGFLGTVGLGLLSDRFRHLPRSAFALASLVGLAGALLLYGRIAASSEIANFLGMALVGALLFGPDALLSGAAAQDAGGPAAAAMAAGPVNAVGSLGAILQELVTRGVTGRYGWGALFYVFVGLALMSALALVPTLRRAPAAAPA